MVTHEKDIAAYAERVIRFQDGHIIADEQNGSLRKLELSRKVTMSPLDVMKIAWKGLNRNKLRSLLTMLGVIIGVAAVIVMIAVSAGTEATIADQITSLGTTLIFVQQSFGRGGPGPQRGSSGGLVYDDATAIAEQIDGV